MIFILPEKFDANEWVTLISIILTLIISLLLPRRFPAVFTLNILLFVGALGKFADFLLGADIPFEFYDYSDTPKLDLFDEFLQLMLYPIVGYLFIYLYDFWIKKGYSKLVFIPLCAFVSLGFEWILVQAHVYTYKGWKYYYSYFSYIIMISMLLLFFHMMKKWIKLKTNQ